MLGGLEYRTIAAAVRRAFAAALGAAGTVILADPNSVGGFQSVPYGPGFKNRLLNPSGRIIQRSSFPGADDTYFVDRWYLLTQTASVSVATLSDPEDGFPKGTRITQVQAAAQRIGFAQIIEGANCKDLRGQNGVLVPRMRISNSQPIRYAILGWTGTEDSVTSDVVNDWTSGTYTAGNFFLGANLSVLAVGTQTPAANTWTSLAALTAALGSSFNNIIIFVWTEGTAAQNVTLDWDYVQFERGSVATEFERRSFRWEKAECQRYYNQGNAGTTGGHLVIDEAADAGGRTIGEMVWYKVTMRAAPSVTESWSYTNASGGTTTDGSAEGFRGAAVTVAGGGAQARLDWTASAEL